MPSLHESFGAGAIVIGAEAGTWEQAVALAGDALQASGCSSDGYTQAMVDSIRELGPYVVIAPGIALPHARPSELVLKPGMSLVTLSEPVDFGHAKNDPVRLVFGLAATDHESHLLMLTEFAQLMSVPGIVNSLLTCHAESEIRALLSQGFGRLEE